MCAIPTWWKVVVTYDSKYQLHTIFVIGSIKVTNVIIQERINVLLRATRVADVDEINARV